MKNIISHHKLSDLLGNMTEVQALNTLSRMRAQANPGGNPAATDLIIKGYKFGIDYPNVGCNQFFTVVIDQLVKSRSKV